VQESPRRDVTEEMPNNIGSTERKREGVEVVEGWVDGPAYPDHED
jgi:hypothetical protein